MQLFRRGFVEKIAGFVDEAIIVGSICFSLQDDAPVMPLIFRKIAHISGSRLARNIYFWLIVAVLLYGLNADADTYDKKVYLGYKVATTCLLVILTYVNNLVLVPFLLARKKYLLHIACALAFLFLMSLAYVLLLKQMLITYPNIQIHEVSIITSPVGKDWSFAAITDEMSTYTFGLGIWMIIFTMAWYMNAYARQEKLAKAAAAKQTEAELGMLRNQLNPHFLFNTLNNIYGLTLKKSDAAPETVLKLSSIMRYILYDADAPLMPFEKEKEIMQAYIDMELLRLPPGEEYTFNIEADSNYNIPPLLWLPVLENVFKHGTRMIAENYFINYSFAISKGIMRITAENNCKETAPTTGGLGLSNLRKRLEILYPGRHEIQVQQNETKYRIEVTVKLS